MKKIIDVEISKLKDEFDIRSLLNDDHIIYLAELIRAGVTLPPVKITKDFKIIDGRHRKEAYRLADIFIIKAEIIDITGTIDIVKEALSSNMGGALPPLKNDLLRTMTILINKGYTRPRIFKEFESIIPLSLLKTSHHHALWRITRQKINNTRDLIAKGVPLEKACELTGAPVEAVKNAIKSKGNGNHDNSHTIINMKNMFNNFNRKLGQKFRQILEDCESGEKTKDETQCIVQNLFKFILNQTHMYNDWNKRWNYKK